MSKSVASSKSGRKRSGHAFQPEPPIAEQRGQINENFKQIINILTKVPTITNDNQQTRQKGESVRDCEMNFQKYATKISDAIHKLFCDTWRSMRTSHKAGNVDSELLLKNILQEEFSDFSNNLNILREAQTAYLYKIVNEKGETPNNSLYLNTQKFINDLFELFSEDLFEILRKSSEFKDIQFVTIVKSHLTKELANISANYTTNIIKLFNLYDELTEPEIEDQEMDTGALIDFYNDHLDLQYDGFKNASVLIHDFRKKIFAFLLNMVKYTSEIHEIEEDKEDYGYETEDDKEEDDELSSLFYAFLDSLKELRGILTKANEKKAEYGLEEEEYSDWERLKLDDYIPLLSEEIKFESDLVLSNLIKLSRIATTMKDDTFNSIYSIFFNFIDERYSENDDSLKATDVSSVYLNYINTSPKIEESEIELLENMLIRQIERSSSKLQDKRSKQLKLLSAPTKKNVDYYTADAKRLNDEIQQLSGDLNLALFQAREGTFIQRSTTLTETSPNYASMSGQDDETDPRDQDAFLSYDDDEGQATQNHLLALLDLNQVAYSRVEEDDTDKSSTKSSRKKRQSFADSSSVYSSGNLSTLSKRSSGGVSSITMTKAQMAKKLQYMDKATRAQVNALDNAITSTYLQRIASMRGYLVGTIRLGQYGEAKRINDIIKKNCVNYQNHLSEARNRASQNLDIQQMQATEEQSQIPQEGVNDDVEKCIVDSFKTYLERLIKNYRENLKQIHHEAHDCKKAARKTFFDSSINLQNNIHLPQGELIEKQRLIALQKERKRNVDQIFREKEQNIRDLVKKNDYNRANAEKEKLVKLKKQDLNDRLAQVNKEFNDKREKLLNTQRKDLQMLEEKYIKKKDDINHHAKEEMDYQLNTFITIIKSTIAKHFSFAIKIIQMDKNQQRVMQLKLEKAARGLLEDSQIKELESIPLNDKDKKGSGKTTK